MSYYPKNLNNMTKTKRELMKESILNLVRLRSAGTPADLAGRFGVSERSIKRMISELKREGYRITFWHGGNTYILEYDMEDDIKCAV